MFAPSVAALALFFATAEAAKRGLAWPWYNGSLNPAKLHDGNVAYIYDWETYTPPSTNGYVYYVCSCRH